MLAPEDILMELKNNTKVKFKETDLFRVYQSIDLVSKSVKQTLAIIIIIIIIIS